MNWQELSVATTEEAAEAVANLFYEVGAAGVVIQDPGDIARYLSEANWDACEIPPELLEAEGVVVKAYLPMNAELSHRLQYFQQQLDRLANYFPGHRAELSLSEVTEEDWSTAWKAYFHPEKIGERVVVAPTWEPYDPQGEEVVVRLDPGMAFGTGNHPTTAMCIRALEKYLSPGDRVLDVGTGSGVLAVIAAKLGAGSVLAVDLDPLAVRIASENVALNQVDDTVEVLQADLLAGVTEKAQLVVANIVADPVMALAPQAYRCLDTGAYFIASGIVRTRLAEVERVLLEEGFALVEVTQAAEWVLLVGQKE